MSDKFYLTTAITYSSQKPHIGNTYEIVLADSIARFKRLMGNDVYFLTGTDEHGQKNQIAAEKVNMTPKEYVDGIVKQIRDIWDLMNTSYDQFIRTTDKKHITTVKKIFKKLYEQGDIYKGEYEGHYCTPCEAFFTKSQLVDGKCPDCGRAVTLAKEEAYFLKLTKYEQRLKEHIEKNPDFIVPESRKREMINNFLTPGLQDLCVSRTSFNWGIPVDFDPGHVVYVWIDALSNYITALGYDPDNSNELFLKNWPCDVHIIGKDILRFHSIYWPILLMALDLPLPKQIFAHPWLLFGDDKMSKSKGNVLYADNLVKYFGIDAVRYYLLSEMPYLSDGSITYEHMIAHYNAELANTLGNLVNRSVAMVNKYFDGVIPKPGAEDEFTIDLKKTAARVIDNTISKMEQYKLSEAAAEIFQLVRRSNKYIDETMPWTLIKTDTGKLGSVLYHLIDMIHISAVLLSPFMPQTCAKILEQINRTDTPSLKADLIGSTTPGIMVGEAVPLFARIDEQKKLEEIAADLERAQIAVPFKSEVEFGDFEKLDLRIAEVIDCEKVPKADKLLKFTLRLGGTTRTVVSGIAKFYNPGDLIGKKVAMIANLKPVKLKGILSEGMILSVEENGALQVLEFMGEMEAGSVIC